MKTSSHQRHPAGYVSFLMVLSTASVLMLLMVFAYRRATTAQSIQSTVQLQLDYDEKEEAILRSIVAIVPNRAIRAMQSESSSSSNSNALSWESIFNDALTLANARQSISTEILASIGTGTTPKVANSGDSTLTDASRIFKRINSDSNYVSAGINSTLGNGYPTPLTCADSLDSTRDLTWPIISRTKRQSGSANVWSTYPDFNLVDYPKINFGYATPGQPFVAKRNWWAFSVDLTAHDSSVTKAVRSKRNMVLSIYEIPSQLAISASSFMALGQHASGTAWEGVNISGGIFAGRAIVEGNTGLNALATRRGAAISANASVGNERFQGANPFKPGVREEFYLTKGEFFPVSLASESGRAAFIPINRGADFFDRFAHPSESSTLSSTSWNNYSVGALQCAMRLDITQAASATDKTPTVLRFSYLRDGTRQNLTIPLTSGVEPGLPAGYVYCAEDGQSYNFGTSVVDVAYGKNRSFAFRNAVTGTVTFNSATFGEPSLGNSKAGYFRPSYPFEVKRLPNGKTCIAVYPQRFPAFLTALRADSTAVNHSLVVNVDYTVATGSALLTKPSIPCTELDYGVILQESGNMTGFTRGFSLVTNLRLYLGDDFNIVPTTAPSGHTPAGPYYPPCSIFSPEKRYGVEVDPLGVNISGQLGSLAGESISEPIRPLESKTLSGSSLPANRVQANLRPITHPSELPPITMMNWLVLLEERKAEFNSGN